MFSMKNYLGILRPGSNCSAVWHHIPKLKYLFLRLSSAAYTYQPPHDKTNGSKGQINEFSKGENNTKMCNFDEYDIFTVVIRPVWTVSSLSAQWVAKDLSFLHADSEYSGQTGRMPRLIWVFAGGTCHIDGLFVLRLISVHNHHQ